MKNKYRFIVLSVLIVIFIFSAGWYYGQMLFKAGYNAGVMDFYKKTVNMLEAKGYHHGN